ncbi:hypothetical protein BDFB_013525, partial [Asbolus verrucosus]
MLGVSRFNVQRAIVSVKLVASRCEQDLTGNGVVMNGIGTTAVETRNRLEEVRRLRISERTVSRRLKEYRLIARRPVRGPELTRNHRIIEYVENLKSVALSLTLLQNLVTVVVWLWSEEPYVWKPMR